MSIDTRGSKINLFIINDINNNDCNDGEQNESPLSGDKQEEADNTITENIQTSNNTNINEKKKEIITHKIYYPQVKIVKVSCGKSIIAFLSQVGKIYCWHLDNKEDCDKNVPYLLVDNILKNKTIHDVSSGSNHIAFVSKDGDLFTYGDNSYGQLGNNTIDKSHQENDNNTSNNDDNYKPSNNYKTYKIHKVNLENNIIKNVYCSDKYTLYLTIDGMLYGFGLINEHFLKSKQNQDKINKTLLYPHLIDTNNIAFKKIAIGNNFILGINFNNNVYSWGSNDNGVLGHGNFLDYFEPNKIENLKNVNFISAGKISLCKTTDDDIYIWGGTYGNKPNIIKNKFDSLHINSNYIIGLCSQKNMWIKNINTSSHGYYINNLKINLISSYDNLIIGVDNFLQTDNVIDTKIDSIPNKNANSSVEANSESVSEGPNEDDKADVKDKVNAKDEVDDQNHEDQTAITLNGAQNDDNVDNVDNVKDTDDACDLNKPEENDETQNFKDQIDDEKVKTESILKCNEEASQNNISPTTENDNIIDSDDKDENDNINALKNDEDNSVSVSPDNDNSSSLKESETEINDEKDDPNESKTDKINESNNSDLINFSLSESDEKEIKEETPSYFDPICKMQNDSNYFDNNNDDSTFEMDSNYDDKTEGHNNILNMENENIEDLYNSTNSISDDNECDIEDELNKYYDEDEDFFSTNFYGLSESDYLDAKNIIIINNDQNNPNLKSALKKVPSTSEIRKSVSFSKYTYDLERDSYEPINVNLDYDGNIIESDDDKNSEYSDDSYEENRCDQLNESHIMDFEASNIDNTCREYFNFPNDQGYHKMENEQDNETDISNVNKNDDNDFENYYKEQLEESANCNNDSMMNNTYLIKNENIKMEINNEEYCQNGELDMNNTNLSIEDSNIEKSCENTNIEEKDNLKNIEAFENANTSSTHFRDHEINNENYINNNITDMNILNKYTDYNTNVGTNQNVELNPICTHNEEDEIYIFGIDNFLYNFDMLKDFIKKIRKKAKYNKKLLNYEKKEKNGKYRLHILLSNNTIFNIKKKFKIRYNISKKNIKKKYLTKSMKNYYQNMILKNQRIEKESEIKTFPLLKSNNKKRINTIDMSNYNKHDDLINLNTIISQNDQLNFVKNQSTKKKQNTIVNNNIFYKIVTNNKNKTISEVAIKNEQNANKLLTSQNVLENGKKNLVLINTKNKAVSSGYNLVQKKKIQNLKSEQLFVSGIGVTNLCNKQVDNGIDYPNNDDVNNKEYNMDNQKIINVKEGEYYKENDKDAENSSHFSISTQNGTPMVESINNTNNFNYMHLFTYKKGNKKDYQTSQLSKATQVIYNTENGKLIPKLQIKTPQNGKNCLSKTSGRFGKIPFNANYEKEIINNINDLGKNSIIKNIVCINSDPIEGIECKVEENCSTNINGKMLKKKIIKKGSTKLYNMSNTNLKKTEKATSSIINKNKESSNLSHTIQTKPSIVTKMDNKKINKKKKDSQELVIYNNPIDNDETNAKSKNMMSIKNETTQDSIVLLNKKKKVTTNTVLNINKKVKPQKMCITDTDNYNFNEEEKNNSKSVSLLSLKGKENKTKIFKNLKKEIKSMKKYISNENSKQNKTQNVEPFLDENGIEKNKNMLINKMDNNINGEEEYINCDDYCKNIKNNLETNLNKKNVYIKYAKRMLKDIKYIITEYNNIKNEKEEMSKQNNYLRFLLESTVAKTNEMIRINKNSIQTYIEKIQNENKILKNELDEESHQHHYDLQQLVNKILSIEKVKEDVIKQNGEYNNKLSLLSKQCEQYKQKEEKLLQNNYNELKENYNSIKSYNHELLTKSNQLKDETVNLKTQIKEKDIIIAQYAEKINTSNINNILHTKHQTKNANTLDSLKYNSDNILHSSNQVSISGDSEIGRKTCKNIEFEKRESLDDLIKTTFKNIDIKKDKEMNKLQEKLIEVLNEFAKNNTSTDEKDKFLFLDSLDSSTEEYKKIMQNGHYKNYKSDSTEKIISSIESIKVNDLSLPKNGDKLNEHENDKKKEKRKKKKKNHNSKNDKTEQEKKKKEDTDKKQFFSTVTEVIASQKKDVPHNHIKNISDKESVEISESSDGNSYNLNEKVISKKDENLCGVIEKLVNKKREKKKNKITENSETTIQSLKKGNNKMDDLKIQSIETINIRSSELSDNINENAVNKTSSLKKETRLKGIEDNKNLSVKNKIPSNDDTKFSTYLNKNQDGTTKNIKKTNKLLNKMIDNVFDKPMDNKSVNKSMLNIQNMIENNIKNIFSSENY
ncbi:regulator of chromosome condensation, putative [Plasmodium vinckei vinckei]|uniref:Regulator of chromosome condensation, putative n=1 Tax=Plasmodium vinckei vinckei TaxID=54757 RepID=A0A449BRE5_PLAVN|nr:regulator of chromosome condensation, putative [Plasmodium vinckei vinckei]VEV56021.1 regulator of chromosome condensation, putative [Plasmodium vinckei vinckei]